MYFFQVPSKNFCGDFFPIFFSDSSPFSNYFVVHNSNKNFDDSIRECNRTGMTLAKISTQLEVRLLQCIIKDSTILNNVWIGEAQLTVTYMVPLP